MPVTLETTLPVHPGATGGNQDNQKIVALGDGGFAVFWVDQNTVPDRILMQRFDALGTAVGARVTALAQGTAGDPNLMLHDVAVASDGRVWMLAGEESGTPGSAILRAFNPNTLTEVAATEFSLATVMNEGRLAAGAAGAMVVWSSRTNAGTTFLEQTTVTSAGVAQPTLAIDSHAGAATLIAAPTTGIALLREMGLTDSTGANIGPFSAATDIVEFEPGSFLVVGHNAFSPNPEVMAVYLQGGTGLANVIQTGTASITSVIGATTAGAETMDAKFVNLGGGRILMVWVADGGDSFVANALADGIYAQVINLNTGSVEGTSLLVRTLGIGSNDIDLEQVVLAPTLLADGRVAITYKLNNGLMASDVFAAIVDPRGSTGITVAATAGADTYVGTAGADTFTGLSNGDRVLAGAGIDTVVFTGAVARQVDLEFPGAFPANGLTLESVENVTGGSGNDQIMGNAAANILSGGVGDDLLSGRLGADILRGDNGNDVILGGQGGDTMDGGSHNDTIEGQGDNDLILGNTGLDLIRGGQGDDSAYGGSSADSLFGNDGADDLFGEEGDDLIDGGLGDDLLSGGAGNDILRARSGADSLLGGDGNDTLQITTEVALIDGGAGTDTLVLSSDLLNPGEEGVHADLTGELDGFGLANTLDVLDAALAGIENLTGSLGSDLLAGDAGINLLRGGLGNDTLVGRSGQDILSGGGGADSFVFLAAGGGADVVRDFAAGQDRVLLLAEAFGDLATAGLAGRIAINATGTPAANANAQLLFDNAGAGAGRLFFDADGNGAGAAVLLATLSPAAGFALADITAADFGLL